MDPDLDPDTGRTKTNYSMYSIIRYSEKERNVMLFTLLLNHSAVHSTYCTQYISCEG